MNITKLIKFKNEQLVDRTSAKLENMNFTDKFENIIPTRKEKWHFTRLCILLTEKSSVHENGFGIYEILLNQVILWTFLMEYKWNFMKINKDMNKIINLKLILKKY